MSKAEIIEELCSNILEQKKVNKADAEIIHLRKQVIIKVHNKPLGHIIEQKGEYKFQFYGKIGKAI